MVEEKGKSGEEVKIERREELEAKIQSYIKDTTSMPIQVFGAHAGSSVSAAVEEATAGATPPEEFADINVDDRAVKVVIDRGDTGCEWAYENDVAVYNNLQRLTNTFNNGYEVVITDREMEDNRAAKRAKEYLELKKEELELQKKTDVLIINKGIFGFGILKKRVNNGNEIIGLVPLDCHEDRCVPIINSMTGELGGETGLGLDPNNEKAEVALIQKGKVAKYDAEGNISYTDKPFYFAKEEIIALPGNERGKFKGISAVRRVLRLVEIKKTLENVVEFIVRRYGPQIWIIVGNKDYNLSNTRIPEGYLRDSDGNPIDLDIARKNYKNAIFKDIEDGIQKWVEGETMLQIAEYGIEPVMKAPQTNLFQYSRYIDLFADYIKVGIFGLDVAGRIDVTSAIMQDRLYRDLKDRARRERAHIENLLHRTLTIPLLKSKGFSDKVINVVRYQFLPLDKTDFKEDAEMERSRSMTVKNYMDAGVKVPKYLQERWGLKIEMNEGSGMNGDNNEPPQTPPENQETQTPPQEGSPRRERRR